jgi:hypothetical protein
MPGSFFCSCTAGYTLSLDQAICIDVNECLEQSPPKCNATETCINSLGGYSCLHKSRVYVPRAHNQQAAAVRVDEVFLNRRVFIGLLTWLAVLTLITFICLLLFWFDDDDVTSDMRRDYIADRKFRWRHADPRRYVFPRLSTNVSTKNDTTREVELFNNNNVVECREIRLPTPTTGTTPTRTPTPTAKAMENVHL